MSRLLFLDTETTGLSPGTDKLLEVGMVVVELPSFEIVAEDSICFHFERSALQSLYIHPKVLELHETNGLWRDCLRSQLNDYRKMDEIVSRFIIDNGCQDSALAGANPGFDRGFLKVFLPGTLELLHYRNFDSNTLWLLQSWLMGTDPKREKPATHRAVDDCKDAIKVVEQHFEFMERIFKV